MPLRQFVFNLEIYDKFVQLIIAGKTLHIGVRLFYLHNTKDLTLHLFAFQLEFMFFSVFIKHRVWSSGLRSVRSFK